MTPGTVRSEPTTLDVAAEWFARKRSGALTAQELFELQAWLDEKAAHSEAFRRIMETWDISGSVATDPDMLALREAARGRRPRQTRLWGGFAALGAAGLCMCLWFAYQAGYFAPVWEADYRTAIGQTTTLTLRDGSIVSLDTDSALRVRISGWERRVELLRGQALFHVAKNPQKRFVVYAAGNSVTATGTKFDVRIDPDRFNVILLEGRVHVQTAATASSPGEAADLMPGWQFSDVRNGVTITPINPDDAVRRMAWLQGRIAVAAEPLGSVADELNRYSVRKIVVAPAIAGERIDGVFRAGDIDGFVNLAKRYHLVRVVSDTVSRIVLDAPKKNGRRHL